MHGEIKKVVVTLVVMRHFFSLPGASRACADFCDPTVVSRFKHPIGAKITISGNVGHDAKKYQERAVEQAIREVSK